MKKEASKLSVEELEELIAQEIGDLARIEDNLRLKQKTLAQAGHGVSKKDKNDNGLLDVLEGSTPKSSKKPENQNEAYHFGRPKTPEIIPKVSLPLGDSKFEFEGGQGKNLRGSIERGLNQAVSRASKIAKIASNQTDFVEKNKQIAAAKQNKKYQDKQDEGKSDKSVGKKQPPTTAENSKPQAEARSVSRKGKQASPQRQPEKHEKQVEKERPVSRKESKLRKVEISSDHESEEENPILMIEAQKNPKSVVKGKEPAEKNSKEAKDAKVVEDKKKTKKNKEKAEYQPETLDLCSKLNEYTKFKENMSLLNDPEETSDPELPPPEKAKPLRKKSQSKADTKGEPKADKTDRKDASKLNHQTHQTHNSKASMEDAADKAKLRAEEFLKLQINNFKEQNKENLPPARRSLSKPDLAKVSQPKHKKQKVEIPEQCSFQPMLSRKSLILAEKMGYDKERLWQSRTPKKDGYDSKNQNSEMVVNAETFQPRICGKSKAIEENKHRAQLPRHEVLHRMGEEYSQRKKRQAREKEKEQEEELKAMHFKPNCDKPKDAHLHKPWEVSIADRNEKWAQKKDERIQRLKESCERETKEECSFQPKIVSSDSPLQTKFKQSNDRLNDSQYYSSAFVKEGIKSYFTRLEQARRIKQEAKSRLGTG